MVPLSPIFAPSGNRIRPLFPESSPTSCEGLTPAHTLSVNCAMSWIDTEALEVDSNKDLVILENPTAVHSLDDLLLNRFIPVIWRYLKATG